MRRLWFPATVIAAATVWLATSAYLWIDKRREVVETVAARAETFTQGVRDAVERHLRSGREDVVMLSRLPAVTRAVAGGAEFEAALSEQFEIFAASRTGVFQVRLLDATGHERVRVDANDGRTTRTLELQDKSQRHYFVEAARLAPGEVYVSPIDLNMERGRVERPLKPAIRFSTPVHSASGEFLGVVVINRRADELLSQVGLMGQQSRGVLTLVDDQGMYIYHPDPSARWGRILGSDRRFEEDYPALAQWLAGDHTRSFRDSQWIASAATIHGPAGSPTIVLTNDVDSTVASRASDFIPLAAGTAGAGILLAGLAFLAWHSRRLAADLAKEAYLRGEIAKREQRLERAQEQLVASARLAALSDSAAALAHEVRNPLAAIVNSASLLRQDEALSGEEQELMTIVLDECERLDRSVRSFLDLAQRPPPQSAAVDIVELSTQVASLAQRDSEFGDMTIQCDSPSTDRRVAADPDEIRQVLWNLIRNAAAANRRGGGANIWLRTAPGPGGAIVLDVEDEGPGPEERGESRRGGIGLIVVAGIAARCGGTFTLEQRPAGGARARLTLPEAEPEDP